ncbi:MAG: transcription termination/antitermination factor NusG [Clostridia bacterium]|nr:transcription termination/antitermination factor NusG [Clostridia bacterium]
MSESAKKALWYVVHTYSGYENKVKTNLEKIVENRGIAHLIQEVKVPVEIIKETKDGVAKESEEKIFPSYVFVKMILSDETWHIVRNITGSAGFVGPEGKAVPLTPKEVEDLGIEEEAKTVLSTSFKVGDSVIIKDGPMQGIVGTISEFSSDLKKVTVITFSFGQRPVPVELDIESIVEDKK